MLCFSGDDIDSKLEMYFKCNNALIEDSGTSKELIDLCCLIMQCLEDSDYQISTCSDNEESFAISMLQDSISRFGKSDETVETIKCVAQTKIALQIVAKYMHHVYGGTESATNIEKKYEMLFKAARKLCEECESLWPRRYFVKQLCRSFGIESYQNVLKEKHNELLKWTELPELVTKKIEECHDRYIVCGEEYIQFREAITQTIMSANSDQLRSVIQTSRRDWKTTIHILLAVHREVTMKNIYTLEKRVSKENLTDMLVDNVLWSVDKTKNIQEGMDLCGQNTVCLLTHFWLLISLIPGKSCVIAPLKQIATEPDKMIKSFLPTMPHDEKFELLLQLRQMAETIGSNSSLKYYRCPNGHIYVIGDCGKPRFKSTCNECGADIGGLGYKLSDGNAAVEVSFDTTSPGHILGAPTERDTKNIAVERKLTGLSLPLVRLLLHMSMFVGSNINLQAVKQTIKNPEIQKVLFTLTELHTANVIAEHKPDDFCELKSKDIRELWENEFTKLYVEPMKQNMQDALDKNNATITQDKRLGADPLLQLLYETDDSQHEIDITKLYDNPAVWRYREQISIPNLRRVLSNSESEYPVLQLFLKEEHHLRALRFIPSILRLQKLLTQRYNRKLEKSETYLIRTVQHDMKIEGKQDEFLQLLCDFKEAWTTVSQSLENYACHTKTATVQLDLQYCRTSINDRTPLSFLLPTHKGVGLCSYMLVAFLLEKQNQFMEQYYRWSDISLEHLPKVQVKEISAAHLISYHPDKDLLPLLLANCNYTFEMGKGTKIEYNYKDLQRQIMDRFLFSKSRITNIKERFGQTQKITHTYMQTLLAPLVPDHTVRSCRRFYDKSETLIRGLESLGQSQEPYGALLIPVMLNKLPSRIKENITRQHGLKQRSFDEHRQHLFNEITILKAGQRVNLESDAILHGTAYLAKTNT
ncbi:RNF213 [Mytilus coruscus]|uniref:RNF213 n=1 Tax=Mytilus coruscus TaxID=42192 RepID=A0A6J8E565_MYTCO|nr:RNF213 [Mytilus coruscus]